MHKTQAYPSHEQEPAMVNRLLRSETGAMLMDQAVVSGGNFLTTLVLARTLMPADYGLFSLLFLSLFGINTCHSSLVVYSLTLRGAVAEKQDLGRLTFSALLHTLLLSLPLSLMLSIVAIVLHHAELCLVLAAAMLAWQLQETTRRILLACRRVPAAILPDALCYVGQAALLFAFRPTRLSTIFLLFALTSILSCAWQLTLLGLSASRVYLREHAAFSWRMGRYVLGGNLLNMFTLQIPSWGLASFAAGAPAVAGYQSLLNLAGVANPIIFSASNLLIPAVAREAPRGIAHARATVIRQGMRYGLLLLPCFAAFCIAPHAVMRLVYGAASPYLAFAPLLRPFVLAFAIQYVATVVGAYEGGMSRPRTYLWVQIAGTVLLLTAGLLMIRGYGIAGAVYAMLLAATARLLVFLLCASIADRKLSQASLDRTPTEVLS